MLLLHICFRKLKQLSPQRMLSAMIHSLSLLCAVIATAAGTLEFSFFVLFHNKRQLVINYTCI